MYVAPKGNDFWKLRTKHGRNSLFSDPELLWEEACVYFKWCDDNPWTKTEFVGKDARRETIQVKRPYTLQGLAAYLDCSTQSIRNYGERDEHRDFFDIIARIRNVISTQQIEGGLNGEFNSNLAARLNDLTDRQDVTSNDKELKSISSVEIVYVPKNGESSSS